ncbi:hypothetical protein C0J52_21002, partial [Blattella germanica]
KLEDIGIISKDNTFNVVDRNKIRKAREKQRKVSMVPLTYKNFGQHFDGCKDKTLKFEDSRRKTIAEERVTLVKEPGSEYIGHLSLSSRKAFNVCAKLVECLEAKLNMYQK